MCGKGCAKTRDKPQPRCHRHALKTHSHTTHSLTLTQFIETARSRANVTAAVAAAAAARVLLVPPPRHRAAR